MRGQEEEQREHQLFIDSAGEGLREELCGVRGGLLKSWLPVLCPREGLSRRNSPASLIVEKHGERDLK